MGIRQSSASDDSGSVPTVIIQCSELNSDAPLRLISTGPHMHSITLDLIQMRAILAGEPVEVVFIDGHEHLFTIRKPANACL